MKKIFLTLTMFTIGAFGLMAQEDMRFGAKAGLNIASLGGDAVYSYDSKLGFHFGGVLEVPFSDKIIVQPEALLSLQGSGGFFEDDLNFWYLNIPVVAKYNVWDEIYVEAGPQVGLLLSNNLEGNTYGGTLQTFENTNGLDLGVTVGAGYRLDDNFYFQLRFTAGFINAIEDVTSKNRVVSVSAVYFM